MPPKADTASTVWNPLALSAMPGTLDQMAEDMRRSNLTLGLIQSDTTDLRALLPLVEASEKESLAQTLIESMQAVSTRQDLLEHKVSGIGQSLTAISQDIEEIKAALMTLVAQQVQASQVIARIGSVLVDEGSSDC